MKIPTLNASAGIKIAIGVVAGIVVVIGGFLLVQNVFTKAADVAPRDLIISDITTNTAKLAWTTDQEVQGVVEYGASPTSLNLFAPENAKTKNHTVEITLLSPATSYYFQIRIGDTKFDNGGVPWTFSTKLQKSEEASTPTPPPLSGAPVATPPISSAVPPTPLPSSSSAFGPLKKSTLKVVPTAVPTLRVAVPTVLPSTTPTPIITSFYCVETDCQQICLKINRGECSTWEFRKPGGVAANNCTGKVQLGSCYLITPTPTWNPLTPTPTITPTGSPTPTPTISSTPNPTVPSYMQ